MLQAVDALGPVSIANTPLNVSAAFPYFSLQVTFLSSWLAVSLLLCVVCCLISFHLHVYVFGTCVDECKIVKWSPECNVM